MHGRRDHTLVRDVGRRHRGLEMNAQRIVLYSELALYPIHWDALAAIVATTTSPPSRTRARRPTCPTSIVSLGGRPIRFRESIFAGSRKASRRNRIRWLRRELRSVRPEAIWIQQEPTDLLTLELLLAARCGSASANRLCRMREHLRVDFQPDADGRSSALAQARRAGGRCVHFDCGDQGDRDAGLGSGGSSRCRGAPTAGRCHSRPAAARARARALRGRLRRATHRAERAGSSCLPRSRLCPPTSSSCSPAAAPTIRSSVVC